MTKYKTIKLRRVHKNLASIRDYVWEDIKTKGMGIIFECNNAAMKLEPADVHLGVKENTTYTSKYDGRQYSLVNFLWRSK